MAGQPISRVGDMNSGGGRILEGASSVVVNGKPVGTHVSKISAHPRKGKHLSAQTTEGSPSVFAEGKAVLRKGSGNDCGHAIAQGSPDVNVP